MDTGMIYEFIELVKTKSYIIAADNLFISQPTLSRHIKKLEEDLGFILIDRNARKFQLTAAGEIFLPYARQITEIQEECEKALQNSESINVPVLRIGSVPMMVPYGITELFMRFRKRYPDVNLVIAEMRYSEMIESIRNNENEFVIAREESADVSDSFKRIIMGKDRLIAVLHKSHPLAGKKQINLLELSEEKVLLPIKDSPLYNLCIHSCRKAGFEPKVSFTSRGISTAIDLASRNMGAALLMRRPVESMELNDQVALVDIVPPIEVTIAVIYRSETLKNPYARNFLSVLSGFLKNS